MFKIRSSILPSWNDCPRRNAIKIFSKDIENIGYEVPRRQDKAMVSSAIGTGFHKGAELALNDKQLGTEKVNLNDSQEMSIWGFRQECKDGVSWDDLTPNANTAEKQLQQMTKTYWNMFLPITNPIDIEVILSATTKNYTLTGKTDIVEVGTIRDLKTGIYKSFHAQAGAYSLLAKANKITKPEKLIIDWIPRAMTKNLKILPRSYFYNVAVAERETFAVLKTIEIQHKLFLDTQDMHSFPCNPGSILCSTKYCQAWGTDWCPVSKGNY